MAKKAVATFAAKAGAKSMVKCIRMDKSPKTGAYVFTELLVEAEKTKDFFVSLGLPEKLSEVGITEEKFKEMAEEAVRTSGIKTRAYYPLDVEDVVKIFEMCR